MSAIGRTYWLRGEPVTLLVLGGMDLGAPGFPPPRALGGGVLPAKRSPRNCLIEYPDGRRVVRPFRGLRRMPGVS